MKEIVGETLDKRLIAWGVDAVFGLPGDGINGIMEGLQRHADKIDFVLVHHEEAAAFMACGYAKATGRLGVCLATSGPGGIHLLNGLYDAKLDHQPVLAITGMQETSVLGTAYQQEVHLDRLYIDVAQGYDLMITNPAQLPGAVDIAIRGALSKRTVSHLCFPTDIRVAEACEEPYSSVGPGAPANTLPVYFPAPTAPREADLRRAADVLNAGTKVAILAGAGALGADQQVLAVADALGAPIVKTLPGKHVVPDDSPYTTGGLGLLGTGPSEDLMDSCDTLLLLGTNYPYLKYLPTDRNVRTVQIDLDPSVVGNRMPTEAPVVGDVRQGIEALLPMLQRTEDRSFLEEARKGMDSWREDMAALEDPAREPIAPQYLMHAVDRLAAGNAILTCDSGTVATWAARDWTIRGNREFYLSGNLATIAVRQRLPIKAFVNNNNAYGQILWEQIVLGYPEFGVQHKAPEPNFAAWATACGGYGAKVSAAGDLPGAVKAALAFDGPALVDCDVSTDEPPMPGKIKYQQAKSFTEAFLRGQPHKVATLVTVARDKFNEFTS